MWVEPNWLREDITVGWARPEVGGVVVATKRVTTVERRAPLDSMLCEKKGVPLGS